MCTTCLSGEIGAHKNSLKSKLKSSHLNTKKRYFCFGVLLCVFSVSICV